MARPPNIFDRVQFAVLTPLLLSRNRSLLAFDIVASRPAPSPPRPIPGEACALEHLLQQIVRMLPLPPRVGLALRAQSSLQMDTSCAELRRFMVKLKTQSFVGEARCQPERRRAGRHGQALAVVRANGARILPTEPPPRILFGHRFPGMVGDICPTRDTTVSRKPVTR